MSIYTVYEPSGTIIRDDTAAERVRFVKEGLSVPALLVPVLWLLYHRMWLVLVAYLLVSAALTYGLDYLLGDGFWAALAVFAFALLFAYEASELRRWSLQRKGYRQVGVVAGHDLDDCERKFFAAWLEASRPQPQRPAQPPAGVAARSPGAPEIIGSFPAPGGR